MSYLLFEFRLPKVVKRRLKALKRLQAEVNKVESKFYEEVHELEQKYAAQYEPFFHRVCMFSEMCHTSSTFLYYGCSSCGGRDIEKRDGYKFYLL